MEPKFEPKQYTPDEIAKMEKSRTLSDAALLGIGAEYVIDEHGEKRTLDISGIDNIYGKEKPKSFEDDPAHIKEVQEKRKEILLELFKRRDEALEGYTAGAFKNEIKIGEISVSITIEDHGPHFVSDRYQVQYEYAARKMGRYYGVKDFMDTSTPGHPRLNEDARAALAGIINEGLEEIRRGSTKGNF